jgi:hypothetical protein
MRRKTVGDQMNRQTVMGVAGCALALLLLPAVASAKKTKFMKCGKPLPLQLKPFTRQPQRIDYLCRNSGCHKSAANDKQNAMKNNFCAPTNKIIPVTFQTFVDLRDAANSEASITIGEPPPSRAKLANIIKLGDGTSLGEGKTVVFVGYVLDARHSNVDKDDPLNKGNGESVQCNLLGCAYNDIHIDLTADVDDRTPCHSIVAEIVPHYRPPAWDLFDSPDYGAFLKTHPVKITGQLFYDDSHVACTKDGKAGFNPARNNAKDFERLALWEIHPIYAIDVCKNTDRSQCDAADASAWFPFTDLQSRLGLASVTPTEKCKATTDNPKSACPGFTARKKHLH